MPTLRQAARSVLLALLVAPLAGGCAETPVGPPTPITELPRPLSASEESIVAASNSFAFDLLREVDQEGPGGNLFLSPLSASMSLGMAMAGARGATLDAMRSTLGFGDLSQHEINVSYRNLIDLLRGLDPKVEMGLANSIWYKQSFHFDPAFFDTTSTYFDARVTGLDFSDSHSVDIINDWVKESTKGKIEKILDGIERDEVMYLINAIYFKGDWTQHFDRSETHDAPFYDSSGERQTGTVRMMHQTAPVQLYRGDDFSAIDLPYGGGAFSMTVLLPDTGVEVDSLVAGLTPERWAAITDGFAQAEEEVYLPRFRMEYKKSLNDPLKALGMGIAFTDWADFSGMTPSGGLAISEVLQKTYVDVDEAGTEAAAVTLTGIQLTSVNQKPPAIRVDRPFLFFIREHLSGTILFAGKMVLPEG